MLALMSVPISGCLPESGDVSGPVKVEIVQTENGFQLLRAGEPYEIKGAGMAIDDIENFATHGGNSIRNWTTDNRYQDPLALLDSAYAQGVTVALCLPMKAERWGFDYDDEDAVAAQLEAFREQVIQYRNHPALLFWIIGNELNHSYTNSKVYDAVNDVARMINELDQNHPTTTTVSGFYEGVIADIRTRAPRIDFISFQLYGSLFSLPERIAETAFDDPFMVTEWGALGYWEMEKTRWGIPIETTSSEKADVFKRGKQDVLARFEDQLIGSYVFLWGQKQERTPTWFGMFTEEGESTEVVDVMHNLWTGVWPANRSPRVESLSLDGKNAKQSVVLTAGETYAAAFDVFDYESDALSYAWEVKPESDSTQVGGDFEEPIASLDGLLSDVTSATTAVTVSKPGKYRLFAYAYDDNGHAAHANIPFLVSTRNEQ